MPRFLTEGDIIVSDAFKVSSLRIGIDGIKNLEDATLYRVVAGQSFFQILGTVQDQIHGILSIIPDELKKVKSTIGFTFLILCYLTLVIQPAGPSISPSWMFVRVSYNLRVIGPTSVWL